MTYLPELSIEENATRNNVSVAAVRKYIKIHNIDRRGDELVRRQKKILKLHKKGYSVKEIMEETGHAYNTIKKYLNGFEAINKIDRNKASSLDNGRNASIIKSYSFNQTEILQSILKLYIHATSFDCDLTYSQGVFYKSIKEPRLKFDKYPLTDDVSPLCEVEYLESDSLGSIVIDLPFLIKSPKDNWCIKDRFQAFTSVKELRDTYQYMMAIAYRLLRSGGYLILKTQDTTTSTTKVWVHSIVEQIATEIGFEIADMFILVAHKVIIRGKMEQQHQARRYHSYFYVFKK